MATEASLVAEIITTDTTRTTTRHGKTFLIPNVSDNSVRPIPTAAVDSRSVTVVPMCAIIVGMGIHVARHVTAVNVIRTVTKMPAGSVSHEPLHDINEIQGSPFGALLSTVCKYHPLHAACSVCKTITACVELKYAVYKTTIWNKNIHWLQL